MSAVTLIIGVDAIMDMARTSLNVFGNCLGCCVMARIEGSFRGEEWREEELARRHALLLEQRENKDDGDYQSDVEDHQDHQGHPENLKDVVIHHNEKAISVASEDIREYSPQGHLERH